MREIGAWGDGLLARKGTRKASKAPVYQALRQRLEPDHALSEKPGERSPNGHLAGIWTSIGKRRRARATPKKLAPGKRAPKRAPKPAPKLNVWKLLDERVDLAKFRPKLAGDIELAHFEDRSGPYVMIANPRDLIHYRIEPGDAEIMALMDGTRSIEEIVVQRLEESGEIELSGVADLVLTLYEANYLERPYVDSLAAVKKALDPAPTITQKFRTFARTQTVTIGSPQKMVQVLHDAGLKWFFNPIVNGVVGVTSILGFIAFLVLVHRKTFQIQHGASVAAEGLILLALNYFLTFAHEVGHALVIVRAGRKVKDAGFQIYFGSPAWFVDSSDALMLPAKKRIQSSFAGPYADMFLAGVASLILLYWPHIIVGHVMYKFVALNYFIIFLNLIPMLELDGYHILSDASRMPELRPRSLTFMRHELFRKLRKLERWHRNEVGLVLYGILGIGFSILALYSGGLYWKQLFGGFVTSLWDGGLVTRLILFLLALFIGGPLIRGAINFVRFAVRKIRAIWRAAVFRFETSWRVEAAELIDALPIFDDVPEETLNELAGRVRLHTYSRGQLVVRQGDRAEAFYVVRSGRLEVFETDPHKGSERVLRVLGRGESFGELAVVQASVRTASVRALEEAEVFEIDRSTFQRLLAEMVQVPEFAPSFQEIAELRSLPAFKHLEPDELAELLDYGEWVSFAPGDIIVKLGDPGDAFYAIGSGQVDVLKGRKLLGTLGPGDHLGEIALLLRVKRTATCRARTPVRAYRLTRKGFDRLLRGSFKKGTLNPHVVADVTWQH
jgi:CRP-like cAMP-binding protein/Zn-dependent protease